MALVAIGVVVAYTLVLVLSVPKAGSPGALLAFTSLPIALIGLSGVAVSQHAPARRIASQQLTRVYIWFGLALAVGLALTVVGQNVTALIVRALGG
jgi:hypothetical protein